MPILCLAAAPIVRHPEAAFGKLRGVVGTRVGYTGGETPNPTYQSVCAGDGHTEALRVSCCPMGG